MAGKGVVVWLLRLKIDLLGTRQRSKSSEIMAACNGAASVPKPGVARQISLFFTHSHYFATPIVCVHTLRSLAATPGSSDLVSALLSSLGGLNPAAAMGAAAGGGGLAGLPGALSNMAGTAFPR